MINAITQILFPIYSYRKNQAHVLDSNHLRIKNNNMNLQE